MKRRLLLGLPLILLAAIAAAILALPSFVASNAHRATIEALASSLTGRQVHVRGSLSLALLPAPELIAGDITIAGPRREVITARSLTLDIALPALLQGRLAARSLTLASPVIAFPWPLPGGPASVAPPPWLTALHAKMSNATISLGGVTFSNVDADVFTGGDGAVAISGTGICGGLPLRLSVALAAADASGRAALTVDTGIDNPQLTAHFAGALNRASEISGSISGTATLPGATPITGTATAQAGDAEFRLTGISLTQGAAQLTGTARLTLSPRAINLDLSGSNLDLATFLPARSLAGSLPPGALTIAATNSRLGGMVIPQFQASLDYGPAGITLHRLTGSLAGATDFTVTGRIDGQDNLSGQAALTSADLKVLLGAADLPDDWRGARVNAGFAGTPSHLVLSGISGKLGADGFTGGLILDRTDHLAAAGQLHFGQLDIAPFIALLRQTGGGFAADGEITADRAAFSRITMTHLLVDAAWSGQLVVRSLSASLYGGIADASFRLDPAGGLTAARASLSIPSAAPLVALLPVSWQPPASLARAPLSMAVLAEGPATALATNMVATLGPVSLTAAPVLNITARTAAGPLTLRHPNAIAALRAFGLDAGLAWPGAGSIALRADMLVSAGQMGLPDFVLSFGDLTADGRILVTPDRQITAQIGADTLALPPLPANITIPWPQLSAAHGVVNISANRVWLAGREILGPSAVSVNLAGNQVGVSIPRVTLAGGMLSGSINAAMSNNGSPVIMAKLNLANADAGSLSLPVGFPYAITAGTLSGQADLTASGYGQATWAATLAGNASLAAANGSLNGFDLAGLVTALKSPNRFDALRQAALTGTTSFASLALAGSFAHGNFTLASASLAGPAGQANATGSIDVPDNDLALQTTLLPQINPPLTLNVATIGNWATPKQIPILRPGLAWSPSP
jgi:uncharacterized protein involved in outer membrane biogenesis